MHIRWHGSVADQVAQGNHEPIGGDDISASAPYSVAMAVGDAPWYSLSWDQWIAVAGLAWIRQERREDRLTRKARCISNTETIGR
jgi:hypothetical protein